MALVRILLGNIKGPQGPQGNDGPEGPQGVAGANGANGVGVSEGGIDGQVLVKDGNLEFQTRWADIYLKSELDIKLDSIKSSIDNLNNTVNDITSIRTIVLTTNWEGDSTTGYTQTVDVPDVVKTSKPFIDLLFTSETLEDKLAQKSEWSKVLYATPNNGSITFTATDKITINLTLAIIGV